MRTVYLGTSEFAATVLRALAVSPHRPGLVLTRPDSRRGRGRQLSPPPVARAARELGIPLVQPRSVNDDAGLQSIAGARPEVLCVCAFGALIKEPLLSAYRILNVHPSLLPRWRGAAPIERAIMAGDTRTGVSIMWLDAGLDSGPVCAQEPVAVDETDTFGSLSDRLAPLGGRRLIDTIERMPSCEAQDERLATYAEKITAADRRLDPARAAVELERVVRALHPHISAQARLPDGSFLGVERAAVLPGPGPAPGELAVSPDGPVLGCAEGALVLLAVRPPGKRTMSGAEFVRGRRGRGM